MIGSYSIGSECIGGGLSFFQPRPLSHNYTYKDVEHLVLLKTKEFDNPILTTEFIIQQISYEIQKIAHREKDWYSDFAEFFISGTANPYWVDISILNPFPVRVDLIVHLAPERTLVEMKTPEEFEQIQSLSVMSSASIFGSNQGDKIGLWAGSLFGLDTKTQKIEVSFTRQPTVDAVTRINYDTTYLDIPDSQVMDVVEAVANLINRIN